VYVKHYNAGRGHQGHDMSLREPGFRKAAMHKGQLIREERQVEHEGVADRILSAGDRLAPVVLDRLPHLLYAGDPVRGAEHLPGLQHAQRREATVERAGRKRREGHREGTSGGLMKKEWMSDDQLVEWMHGGGAVIVQGGPRTKYLIIDTHPTHSHTAMTSHGLRHRS
jgi:hypothetical protein